MDDEPNPSRVVNVFVCEQGVQVIIQTRRWQPFTDNLGKSALVVTPRWLAVAKQVARDVPEIVGLPLMSVDQDVRFDRVQYQLSFKEAT